MKLFLFRAVAKAAPFLVAVARILFAEGLNDVEKTVQNALRTVAQAMLRRVPQEV